MGHKGPNGVLLGCVHGASLPLLQSASLRLAAFPEPPPGAGATSLRFALPNGAKLQVRLSRRGGEHSTSVSPTPVPPHCPQRRFPPTAPLSAVADFLYVASSELGSPLLPPRSIEVRSATPSSPHLQPLLTLPCCCLQVSTNLPRRTFRVGARGTPESSQDLQAAGLHPQAMLFVTLGTAAIPEVPPS